MPIILFEKGVWSDEFDSGTLGGWGLFRRPLCGKGQLNVTSTGLDPATGSWQGISPSGLLQLNLGGVTAEALMNR